MKLFHMRKRWCIQAFDHLPKPYSYDVQQTYCSICRPNVGGVRHIIYESCDGLVYMRESADMTAADHELLKKVMSKMNVYVPEKASRRTWRRLESREEA